MKRTLACALSLLTVLATPTGVAQAQDANPAPAQPAAGRPNRPGGPGGPGGPARPDRAKQLTEQLGLSPEQVEKLHPILTEENKKRRSLVNDASLTPAARREQMGKLGEETRKKVREAKILTDDQMKKWDSLVEEQRKRAAEGGQRGNGNRGNGGGRGNRGGGGAGAGGGPGQNPR